MIAPQNAQRKKYGLRALAVIFLLLGGAFIYIGSHNFTFREIGILLILASTYLVKVSNARNRSALPEAPGEVIIRKEETAQGGQLWIVSVFLVPVVAGAWYLLDLDARNGSHEAWPVYVFAGVALACAVVWGLLMAKLFGGRGGGN